MTESAAPIEHVRSDALPPITPAQAAAFQEACAAAAAIHSARELGVIARISEAPADPRRRLDDLLGPFPFTLITATRR